MVPALCFAGAAENRRSVVSKVEPPYPEIARQMHVGGSITLEVTVLPDGRVTTVKVASGHPLLAMAAEQAVKKWRFVAAEAKSIETIAFEFQWKQ